MPIVGQSFQAVRASNSFGRSVTLLSSCNNRGKRTFTESGWTPIICLSTFISWSSAKLRPAFHVVAFLLISSINFKWQRLFQSTSELSNIEISHHQLTSSDSGCWQATKAIKVASKMNVFIFLSLYFQQRTLYSGELLCTPTFVDDRKYNDTNRTSETMRERWATTLHCRKQIACVVIVVGVWEWKLLDKNTFWRDFDESASIHRSNHSSAKIKNSTTPSLATRWFMHHSVKLHPQTKYFF